MDFPLATSDESPHPQHSVKYLFFLIFYLSLYEIFDTYTTSFYPTVTSFILDDFNITISIYYIALMVASFGLYLVVIIQFAADKYGRKPIIIFVFFGMGLSLFILGHSESIGVFTFSLFLMFVFFSSDIWVIIISEEVPPEKRGRYSYLVSIIGVAGIAFIMLFRTLLLDPDTPHTWVRMTYFAWEIMPLSFLGFWLKETKAFEQMKRSRSSVPPDAEEKIDNVAQPPMTLRENIHLQFSPENRNITWAFIVIGLVLGINYTTFQTFEELLSSHFSMDEVTLIITVGSVGTLLVFAITGVLADKFGRRPMISIYAVVVFIGITGLSFSAVAENLIWVCIFGIICNAGFWGVFTLSKIYCVECFDTNIRGSSAGWRSFAYAVGLTIGALISAGLTLIVPLHISYIINATWFITVIPFVVYKILPETRGKIL